MIGVRFLRYVMDDGATRADDEQKGAIRVDDQIASFRIV
jgi:hypothetical protein